MDAPKNPELEVHDDFDEISLHSDPSYEIMQEKPADVSEKEVKESSRLSEYALEKVYPVLAPRSSKPVNDNAATAARKRVWLKQAAIETNDSDDIDAKSVHSIESEFDEDEGWIPLKKVQTNQVVEDLESKIKSLEEEIEDLKIQDEERNLRERNVRQMLGEVKAQNAKLTANHKDLNHVKKLATTLEQVIQEQSHDSAIAMKRYPRKEVKDKAVHTKDSSTKAHHIWETFAKKRRKADEEMEKLRSELEEAKRTGMQQKASATQRLNAAEATIDDLRQQNEMLKLAKAKEQRLPFFCKDELVVSWDLERQEIEALKSKLQTMRQDTTECERLRSALKALKEEKQASDSFATKDYAALKSKYKTAEEKSKREKKASDIFAMEEYAALMRRYKAAEEEREKLAKELQEEKKASAGQASVVATLKNAGNTLANQNDRANLEINMLYNLNAVLARERDDARYEASRQTRIAYDVEGSLQGNLQLVRDQLDSVRAENENLKIIQEELLHQSREAQRELSIVRNGPYPVVTRLANGVVIRTVEVCKDNEDSCPCQI